MAERYTYEQGLKILDRFGFNQLTDAEKECFRKYWDETYDRFNGNVLQTIGELYMMNTLSFVCGPGGIDSLRLSLIRNQTFPARVATTKLQETFKENQLEDILR